MTIYPWESTISGPARLLGFEKLQRQLDGLCREGQSRNRHSKRRLRGMMFSDESMQLQPTSYELPELTTVGQLGFHDS